mmetsp:Transcript_38259/g.96252  ORF Transcript_38259/g.96252 Transcript_38259/m.96252 type:complete len:321 (+) Transcript_38259:161-1123(+)|eukprot:CAMPEP_0177655262 /NCGR_PEP_ID=MMETSP0447-20121125/14851_1 /TAXON_ID=0 /ORGANISM="Stygamoeba regulata, Strain BSH-02190019" /LENGTH=320 /DNA_ID=CAMNT_0019159125 /DNA_START=153 /DNA_END=1115 /DNA_ORIENTATION=-
MASPLRACNKCRIEILPNQPQVNLSRKSYHEECFECFTCRAHLESTSGAFTLVAGNPYCTVCIPARKSSGPRGSRVLAAKVEPSPAAGTKVGMGTSKPLPSQTSTAAAGAAARLHLSLKKPEVGVAPPVPYTAHFELPIKFSLQVTHAASPAQQDSTAAAPAHPSAGGAAESSKIARPVPPAAAAAFAPSSQPTPLAPSDPFSTVPSPSDPFSAAPIPSDPFSAVPPSSDPFLAAAPPSSAPSDSFSTFFPDDDFDPFGLKAAASTLPVAAEPAATAATAATVPPTSQSADGTAAASFFPPTDEFDPFNLKGFDPFPTNF